MNDAFISSSMRRGRILSRLFGAVITLRREWRFGAADRPRNITPKRCRKQPVTLSVSLYLPTTYKLSFRAWQPASSQCAAIARASAPEIDVHSRRFSMSGRWSTTPSSLSAVHWRLKTSLSAVVVRPTDDLPAQENRPSVPLPDRELERTMDT